MIDVYPGVDDWDRQVLDLLPGVSRAGVGRTLALASARLMADTELLIESVAREVADPEVAGTWVASRLCYRYGVSPVGITDVRELRRLAQGGAASLGCDGSLTRAYAMWTALTGSTTVQVRRHHSSTSFAIRLLAKISWEPSRQWVAQAGAIASRCVGDGGEVEAVVYIDGAMPLGGYPPLGIGTLAWWLPTT